MRVTLKASTAICGLILLSPGVVMRAQDRAVDTDRSIGTWKLNLEKSRFPGPKPQIEVRRYWLREDGFLVGLAISVDAQGNPAFVQFAAKPDGRDYPEYTASTLADLQATGRHTSIMYAQKNVDAYAAEVTLRREGRVTTTGSRVVSKDGSTMTIMLSTMNPQGQTVTTVRVFDRQ